MAAGLDRDDTVIRRRLRQKLEFIAEAIDATPPTDAELEAWLDAHPGQFRTEPEVSLRQVYVSVDRRCESARGDAEALLARLRAAGPDAAIDTLGDRLMLPRSSSGRQRASWCVCSASVSRPPSSRASPAGGSVRSNPATACTWCSCATASTAACPRSTRCARSSSASS